MLIISKEKSVIHKGIAILMMIYSHLFFADNTALCVNSFYINGEPLAKFFTYACNPVFYFLLLSGYGHAVCFYTKGISFKSEISRIVRLYIYYWVVLFFFLLIGHYYYPDDYPGSLSRFIWGVSAFYPYIGALWFLLPYACIALCSKYIIITVGKIGGFTSFSISLLLALMVIFFSKQIMSGPFLVILSFLGFIYPFVGGVFLYRTNIHFDYSSNNFAIMGMILIAFLVAGFFRRQFALLFPFLLLILFNFLSIKGKTKSLLIRFGKESMPMWMIHTIFCSYFFRNQLYSLKYPIVVYIVLVLISYFLSLVVDKIVCFLYRLKNKCLYPNEKY